MGLLKKIYLLIYLFVCLFLWPHKCSSDALCLPSARARYPKWKTVLTLSVSYNRYLLSVPSYVSSKPDFWNCKSVACDWNVVAHAQKSDFVFRRNGRVHLSRQGRQFIRLLAAEVCSSAVVRLHTPCSVVVWRVLAIHSIGQFPPTLPLPCVYHRVPSHFNWTLRHTW